MTVAHRVLAGSTGVLLVTAITAVLTMSQTPSASAAPDPLVPHVAPLSTTRPLTHLPDLPGLGRPVDGAVLRSTDQHGDGELIADGGAQDAVMTLSSHGKAVRSVYVRAGQKPTLVDVPDGTYTVWVTTGRDYVRPLHRFLHTTRAQRFVEPITFTTSTTQYTWWELTVDDVPDGNAPVEDVDAGCVPV